MIPANYIAKGRMETLSEYLIQELRESQAARKPLEDLWIRWDKKYKAEPDPDKEDFPFEGAANLTLPVIATDVDTIFARLAGTLFGVDNLWSVAPSRPEMVDVAPRVEEFLKWAQDNEIKPYDPICDWLLEMCKKGTGVMKQRYTRQSKKVFEWRETDNGIWQQQAMLLLKDNPTVHHVSLADFYVPAYANNIQDAPWVGERIMLTYDQYLERVAAGVYTNIANFQGWWANQRPSTVEQNMQELDRYRPNFGKQFEFFEFWLDFDIDGDMNREALVVTIHPESRSIARVDFNPFFNQDKPYSSARYMRQEKRFYGIGLCEMLEQFQDEMSTQHNQRLDNQTLANSVMMKARKGQGITQDEPIYAGRIWLVNDMADLDTMQMGQKYDSTVNEEQMTLQYSNKRTGVNDLVSGNPTPAVGYTPAFTAGQMLQAGAKRFDQTLREVNVCLGETGTRVLELYQQYNQRGKEFIAMGPEDGTLVHAVLQFPLDLIRRGLKVSVTATDASTSKETRIRTNMLMMQQLMQFYEQYMQGMSYIFNPGLPPAMRQVAVGMVQGASIVMRRILDDYGVQDASRIIPELQSALAFQNEQLTLLSQSFGGGGSGNPPAPGASGMAALPPGGGGATGGAPAAA